MAIKSAKQVRAASTDILLNSTFEVSAQQYRYVKAKARPTKGNHFMVSADQDEVTVVTTEADLRHVKVAQMNADIWVPIALNLSSPFYSVGLIAEVTAAIAATGMDLLVVSTFSKDYVLVTPVSVEKARLALLSLGLSEAVRR